ncbi:MAG: hypothetical protein ONB13_12400, partial [candidate division KSB1 bacterium]|nr:hypothetical protein [candidate division KSB1 bacterium]
MSWFKCRRPQRSSDNAILNYCNYLIGIVSLTFLNITLILAQPSGGPYGPMRQNYPLPKISGQIYFVSPDGLADASGTSPEQPTTLEAAIERVKSGDAIILRGGIYRTGNLIFNQRIIMQPYRDEQPILKGTYVATDWQNLGNGLWKTSWPHLFPARPADWWRRDRAGKQTPLHRCNHDMASVAG